MSHNGLYQQHQPRAVISFYVWPAGPSYRVFHCIYWTLKCWKALGKKHRFISVIVNWLEHPPQLICHLPSRMFYIHGLKHNFEFRPVSRFQGTCVLAGLISISQQFMPILEGISVEKSKLRWGRFHFTSRNGWEIWFRCKFRVITMRGWGIFISWPCIFRWGRGTQI